MATYQLQRWIVGHYVSTARQPAYAEVTLQGIGSRGLLRRHTAPYQERIQVELLRTDTADARGSQALVRRAMTQSADKWKGRP
ncbi:MAG TPA: hypothetical protein VF120_07470 [Ktedonobacterales bacterium]